MEAAERITGMDSESLARQAAAAGRDARAALSDASSVLEQAARADVLYRALPWWRPRSRARDLSFTRQLLAEAHGRLKAAAGRLETRAALADERDGLAAAFAADMMGDSYAPVRRRGLLLREVLGDPVRMPGKAQLLGDILDSWRPGESWDWGAVTAELVRAHPDRYPAFTASEVRRAALEAGVAEVPLQAGGLNLRGCRLTGVQQAQKALREAQDG